MPDEITITIQNKLVEEKRDLNVYHHADKAAYIISHSNVVSVSLRSSENGDYLHLSIVSGPGSLKKECWLNMPSWCDFSVSGLGNGDLIHSGGRTFLRIPPGPPVWQLKLTCLSGQAGIPTDDYIEIGDNKNIGETNRGNMKEVTRPPPFKM